MHASGVHPLLHSKIRNAPFPRPCGATGNDAQKLHARAFAHVRDALLMHEVLYRKLLAGRVVQKELLPMRKNKTFSVMAEIRSGKASL